MEFSKPAKKLNTIQVSSALTINSKITAAKPKSTIIGKNLKAYISHYCNTTTIHGVKYIGENGRYLIEKLVWFCIIVIVCSFCLFLINKTYTKWRASPVIVSFETKETSIFDIPFPAVTICPEVKINPDVFNFTKHAINKLSKINVTKREETLFDASLLICNVAQNFINLFGIKFDKLFVDEETCMELYLSVPEIYIDQTKYYFLGKEIENPFFPTITEDGVCFTFNAIPYEDIVRNVENIVRNKSQTGIKIKEWSLEEGYPPGNNLDSYPRRTFLSGLDGGLVINGLFANHSQLDHLCQGSIQGFKVLLHHPSELPNMDKHFRLPLNQAMLVAIKPTMITVSKELIQYDPKDRKCYFAEEKYLSLYKLYSQQNCLSECLVNFTFKKCGCVSFWMPHKDGTKICGPGKTECVKESKINYLRHNEDKKLKTEQCECLPACTSLSYNIETSQTNWNWREMLNLYFYAVNLTDSTFDTNLTHLSELIVYYKDLQFLTSKRHELYGIVDFFSNIGGLLGLFLGFSVISAIEIIHFFTLRIVCNINKYGGKFWSGEPELVNA